MLLGRVRSLRTVPERTTHNDGVRMRILMVQPAPFEPGRLGLENACWLSEPVAFTSLAAMVPEHEVRILDMRLEEDGAFNRALVDPTSSPRRR